ncbi:MAG: SCP2 sterol-binding domain-containing protein [Candidatus Lokiarchaeota archaeon]|nr:SCP2 sterol-binding domain-containing protein [Candidatus Harpocratesius repetitus]
MNMVELLEFFSHCEQWANSSEEFFEEFEDVELTVIIKYDKLESDNSDNSNNSQKSDNLCRILVFEINYGKLKFQEISQQFELFLIENKYSTPKIEIQSSEKDLIETFNGNIDPWKSILSGDVKLSGDIEALIIFEKLFSVFYEFVGL